MKTPLLALFVAITTSCNAQGYTLYGVTEAGGLFEEGTIFSYAPDTHGYLVLYSFGTDSSDGRTPQGALIQASNGLLYGVTLSGGANQRGTIFSYNIVTGNYSKLYDLGVTDNCSHPAGALVEGTPGVLFGMTTNGGTYGLGTMFSYNIISGAFSKLHDFGYLNDGYQPSGSFAAAGNNMLYATTPNSQTNDAGTIFSYNLVSHAETVLFNFDSAGNNLCNLQSPAVLNDSLLYGPLFSPYSGLGSIFNYNINTNIWSTVCQFQSQLDGTALFGVLIKANNGLLYGTATEGGTFYSTQPQQSGVLYSYDPVADTEIVLHNFGDDGDGFSPYSSLIQASDGLLYGMTLDGGRFDDGLMYSYNIATNQYVALHHFTGDTDGRLPRSSLLQVGFPASIAEITPATQLQISPNPSTGQFTIQLPGTQDNYPVQIYNPLGQKIEQLTLTQTQNTLNLTHQPNGIYFVNVQTDLGNVTAKVVITR